MRGADADSGAPLGVVVLAAWPLLLSILLLMVGSGLQGALLGVRAERASFDATVTGLVLGLYYLGYVAGSQWVPGLIRSVGHIRVFASLASIASAAVVVHGVWVSPLPWMVLRFTTGVCIAGLFIVSESWLNDVSTSSTRGSLLAVYNSVVTAGLTMGSLLLNVADVSGFVLFVIGSVALSMAAVPVALAPHDAPPPREHAPRSVREIVRSAPLGIAGAALSGLGTGAALGFGAVYATRAGFGVSGASQFVAALLVGAVVGQFPLGRWSDRTDRRLVMAAAALLVAAGAGVGLAATAADSFPIALVAALLIGAGAFALYGLSFAHVADYVEASAMPATGARLITFNGLGAAAGPFLASATISAFGPEGIFYVLGVATVPFVAYVGVRLRRRGPVSEDRRAHYAPMSSSTTVAGVDDLASEVSGVELDEHHRAEPVGPRSGR
ncbi:MAG TPA: MFS transporter [Acidimicrobiales bacterium]|nr:MFS transporter [Acidimicrobiales bacterium]